jgi:hypothetical protein
LRCASASTTQIVTHTGSLTSGHYIAYVRARDAARETERLSDLASGVKPSSAEEAAAQAFRAWRALQTSSGAAGAEGTESGGRPESGGGGGLGVLAMWRARYSWFRLDDSKVLRVREATVADQQAYMLLYVRRDCWREAEEEGILLNKAEALAVAARAAGGGSVVG